MLLKMFLPKMFSNFRLNFVSEFWFVGKRRFTIKLWKTFTDCFNCLPIAAIVDEKIFCCHGGSCVASCSSLLVVLRPQSFDHCFPYFSFCSTMELYFPSLQAGSARTVHLAMFVSPCAYLKKLLLRLTRILLQKNEYLRMSRSYKKIWIAI